MDERPQTEVWFRAPLPYLSEARELGVKNFAMDKLYMQKRRIDNPVAWASLNFGLDSDWRFLEIDHHTRAAYLWEAGSRNYTGVFPIYSCTQPLTRLISLIEDPWYDSDKQFFTRKPDYQDHVIVVTDLPSLSNPSPLSPAKRMYQELSQIQEDNPEVKLIIHGSYSFSNMFGLEFKAVTYEPGNAAGAGKIFLPCGRSVTFARDKYAPKLGYWYNLLGSTYARLKADKVERRLYNIRSGLFAGRYYKRIDRFRVSRGLENMLEPSVEEFIKTNSMVFTSSMAAQPGDRVVCDDCSLWLGCKLYREGAICAVPNSPMKDVAKLFKNRDADSITTALTALAAANVERIESAMEAEAEAVNGDEGGGIDPDLTRLMESTFKMGDRLLQIVDPSQRPGKTAVAVQVNNGAQRVEITQGQPQQQVAHIYKMLEDQGYARADITPDLVAEVLANMGKPELGTGKVIQGEVA